MIHYIYIPGLGDRFDPLRRAALQRWKRRDVQVTLVPMRWADNTETYEQKYARVVAVITQAAAQKTILVGESAGGAMALLTFCRQQQAVHSVVTVCGYNKGAAEIGQGYRRSSPALYPLLRELDKVLPGLPTAARQRITTIYSLHDSVVSPRHSQVDGAHETVLRTPGHLFTITRILLVGLSN